METTISTNTVLTQSLVNSYVWPVIISDDVTVTLGQNIIFDNSKNFFMVGGNNIIFDGNNYTITIQGVTNYNGAFSNSISMFGFENIVIKNLGILTSNNSTLADLGGWICQSNFGGLSKNLLIYNCYSTGVINGINSGGIMGYRCASGGDLTIENCFTTGIISGKYAGGIIGSEGCYGYMYDTIQPNAGRGFVAAGGNGNDDEA